MRISAAVFGEDRAAEGAALASRAPLDLRVNTLKSDREKALAALTHLFAAPARVVGARFAHSDEGRRDAKSPAVHAEPRLHQRLGRRGAGRGLAACGAVCRRARPGEQVVDLCAGAGGKTLALAAGMRNQGQIYATDDDKRRLAPIHDRLARAGVRNVRVITPRGEENVLADLEGHADCVPDRRALQPASKALRRRNPDAKWRMRPGALAIRIAEQVEILDRAVALAETQYGRIVYITCSVLDDENGAQGPCFPGTASGLRLRCRRPKLTRPLGERAFMFQHAALVSPEGLCWMTPRRTDTDVVFRLGAAAGRGCEVSKVAEPAVSVTEW